MSAKTQPNSSQTSALSEQDGPVRIGVVGLVHTHVHWILGREDRSDIEIVGIVEPNRELAQRYSAQHGFPMDLVFDDLEEMLEEAEPEAVTAFNTIYGHLEVVKACAPRGIHVMVEKPLAVSLEHAREMRDLAKLYNILLLTNYETTWYPSNHEAFSIIKEDGIGDLRKVVFHHGHPGPVEIGCNPEFLEWLTDPVMNGGGAITDFGCYGANLMTWLMDGIRPLSVQAFTRTFKPDVYPKVDDDATIILQYPESTAIIQASWNWPVSRKDMEVYGSAGQLMVPDRQLIRIQPGDQKPEESFTVPDLWNPFDDPFAYLAAHLRGRLDYAPGSLSSLENNMVVMEILDAAIRSAASGKVVELEPEAAEAGQD